ncbi:hypothetical protein HY571_01850 [Candidatus Micrarchaeota archaeon]|nr:hypothetical protein [Candidatus Micrarchaeota archaeon]
MMEKIAAILALMLLLISAVSAVPMPSPVVGYAEINGVPSDSVSVTVTNKATGEVLTYPEVVQLKSERGKFAFDLLNFKQGFTVKDRRGSGDMIEVKVCEFVPECVQTFELTDTSVRSLAFNIVTSLIEPTRYVCSDGSVVASADTCQKEPVPVEKVYACADGAQVSDLSDCPLSKTNVRDVLKGSGITGAGLLVAALIAYYWKKGKKARAKKMLVTVLKKYGKK